jgi:hypothetical protein
MANPRIIPKKSVVSKVPLTTDLVSGEVAVNYADQQWYGKHPSTGAVVEIGAPYLHSHDQLLSLDKANELELTNAGNLVLSVGANATTFTPTSTTNRTLTLPDKNGTLATLDDISGGSVSIEASAADALTATDGAISAADAGADKLLFWDDSAGKLTHLELGSNLSISGTTLSVGTVASARTLARFTPRENQPPATAFATLDTRNSIAVLDFDAATDEAAIFSGVIPDYADLSSGLKIRLAWMATSATSGNVRWGVQLERCTTDLDADSFDAATLVTSSANGTSGIVTLAEITATNIDSLAVGDTFRIKVFRDADDATNDTMTGDAELIAAEIQQVA